MCVSYLSPWNVHFKQAEFALSILFQPALIVLFGMGLNEQCDLAKMELNISFLQESNGPFQS